jgi:hypothetical protein
VCLVGEPKLQSTSWDILYAGVKQVFGYVAITLGKPSKVNLGVFLDVELITAILNDQMEHLKCVCAGCLTLMSSIQANDQSSTREISCERCQVLDLHQDQEQDLE